MMNDLERRNKPLFPISIVMELSELSARQIRYYEEHQLIKPARTKGQHRLFSFSDIDRLLEIKSLLEKKVNLAGIKEIFARREIEELEKNLIKQQKNEEVKSQINLRKKITNEIIHQKTGQVSSLIQGDITRFFQ